MRGRIRLVAYVCAGVVGLIGARVVSGWITGWPPLPDGMTAITMKTNAALGLLLGALSLGLLVSERGPWSRRLTRILSAAVLLISGLTAGEHLTGRDLGIDQMLAHEPPGALGAASPNRMGPVASVCLFLAALGILDLSRARTRGRGQWLAAAVCFVALLPTIGYLYGASELYGLMWYTAIAPQTAGALLLLGLGLLCARPGVGPMALVSGEDAAGAAVRRLLLPALVLPGALGWLSLHGQRLAWVDTPMGTSALVLAATLIATSLIYYSGTKLRQAAEAERAAQSQELQILESITDAFFALDENWRFSYVNHEAERLLRLPRHKLIGSSIWDRFPDAIGSTFQKAYQRVVREQAPAHFEEYFPPHEAWYEVHAYPWQGGVCAYFRDVTSRRQYEQALRAAKEQAELANRTKDHFLAVLSHELRTPLTPVLAAASAMESDPTLHPSHRENIELIRRNIEMEARLIDDLLDVTRIARGKLELDRHPVDLVTVLRRAIEVCQPDLALKTLRLDTQLPDAPQPVDADASRLQQVFWNLLKNAIKFTPAGGRISVRCWRDGNELLAEVSDSGVGIEPDLLPQVFNAFEQGGVGTTRVFGGLGLGLAICKGLVEMHGGAITAHSDGRNRGARFVVRLPACSTPASPTPHPHAAQHRRLEDRRLRILLVEDHADTARILTRLLGAAGHDVAVAADLATALDLASRGSFELLISDLGLPDGSGLELVRHLRAGGVQTPAIALSGYGQETDIQASRAAGFDAHLTKPVSFEHLQEAVADAVEHRPVAGSPH